MIPYAKEEKEWTYKQITSLDKSIENLKETFARAGSFLGIENYCEIENLENKKGNDLFCNCN
ncbi:hypothetical protein [Confluentibacter lentus]|uniref:hypothetical protein n=1 Tax=Confluentibacter lentus TaxID=1699412 RepID=UPI000C28994B|nr:hypothetical protein [Confluentibacter lentus]